MAILYSTFPPERRGTAVGLFNLTIARGITLGRFAGFLVDAFDWRMVLYLTLPFGMSSALLGFLLIPQLGQRRHWSIDPWGLLCRHCHPVFNERIRTPFNRLQYPTDVVCLVVFWRLRYTLSPRPRRDVSPARHRVTHEAIRDWEGKLAPSLIDTLRRKRHGAVQNSWYVGKTYVRVQGQWRCLYRGIDRAGNIVAVQLSDTRDLTAAEVFFRSAWTVTGVIPDRTTTDGHDAHPRPIRNVFGDRVTHRTNRSLNKHLEQDHRGIKPRYRPMYGLKSFDNAARFRRLFDEIRAFLRPLSRCN
jgi:transposase-like protein